MQLYYGGHTYEVFKSAERWDDAADYAESVGGYLAKVGSKTENTAIFKFLQKDSETWDHHYIAEDGGDAMYVWLGGNDIAKEGKWHWSDGTALTYKNWGYGGEPDNYHNQDGMAIGLESWPVGDGSFGKAGQWNDINIQDGLYSLIEWDGLYGTKGVDKIVGSKLNETMYSSDGRDTLFGMGGNDKIQGGRGNDQLYGGTGSDTFIYSFKADSTTTVFDTIHDFSQKQHDRIDLRNVIAGKFDFIGTHGFSGDGPEVRYDTKSGHSTLSIDVTGDGKADMKIFFDGTIHFHEGDFLL